MSDITLFGKVMEKLDVLLTLETEALRRLDHETLNHITDQKVALLDQMVLVKSEPSDAQQQRMLRDLRARLLENQILMVSARELTQGVIDQFTGHGASPTMPGARLLEVRG